jgi:hypothetical protein
VGSFAVSNWLSTPIGGPMSVEAIITNPESTFYAESTLIDKHTGRFARLYACTDLDVALG